MDQARFDSIISEHGGNNFENVRYIAATSGKNWHLHSKPGAPARYSVQHDNGTLTFTHNDEVGPEVEPVIEITEVEQVEIVAFFRPQT